MLIVIYLCVCTEVMTLAAYIYFAFRNIAVDVFGIVIVTFPYFKRYRVFFGFGIIIYLD